MRLVPKIGRFPIVVDDALHGLHGPLLDRVIATLIRFSRQGQQILLLTGDEEVASRVRAHNGWVCHLRPRNAVAMDEVVYGSWRRPVVASEPARDINQWLHAYANEQDMEPLPFSMRTERTPLHTHGVPTSRGRQFFLSERSWVDELPSIDAKSALRLREKGILDVATFLKSDPQQLADLLGVRHVDSSTILAWQAEASLMCGVPQLRAFDARLLVACGITGPQMLAQMHPGQLLKRVEAFLATTKGKNCFALEIVMSSRALPLGLHRPIVRSTCAMIGPMGCLIVWLALRSIILRWLLLLAYLEKMAPSIETMKAIDREGLANCIRCGRFAVRSAGFWQEETNGAKGPCDRNNSDHTKPPARSRPIARAKSGTRR